MSGGHWDYANLNVGHIANELKSIVEYNDEHNDYSEKEPYNDYSVPDLERKYSKEIIVCFKKLIPFLELTDNILDRIDYYFSGDVGEEQFLKLCDNLFKNFKVKEYKIRK